MYDTLMQMGRWFGYRDGYADLCRIYMPSEAISWYEHISDVIEELRDDFKRMKLAGMTPKDFGLCVRSHPESLIVTARNKMRSGKAVIREVDLQGRLVETAQLFAIDSVVQNNINAVRQLINNLVNIGQKPSYESGYLWKEVQTKNIIEFLNSFKNHPASQLTEPGPLKEYIEWINAKGSTLWDVVLVSLAKNKEATVELEIEGFKITAEKRRISQGPGNSILVNKHRVASRGLEQVGLTEQQIIESENKYVKTDVQPNQTDTQIKKINIPDYVYRETRERPLLMLHLLDCRLKENETPVFVNGIIAFGISFPGKKGSRKPEKLVEYIVNTTWWKNNYIDFTEEEESEEDE
jgi:hypothetical protein